MFYKCFLHEEEIYMEDNKTMIIKDDYITLGQMIKHFKLISNGGEEKLFLSSHDVTFNGEKETRRGKKVRPGDIVKIDGVIYQVTCTPKD